MKPNLPQHPCAGKCQRFTDEQCKTCLVQQIEDREFQLGLAPDEAYVKSTAKEFTAGDLVVFKCEHTFYDYLLEVISNSFHPNLIEIKIKHLELHGPVLKTDIRFATISEIQSDRRLTPAEQALAEVS